MNTGLRLIVTLTTAVFVGCNSAPAKVETTNSNPPQSAPVAEAPSVDADYKTAPQSLMKAGSSPFIEYQGAYGDKRRAWLTNTDVHSFPPSTDDPKWMERDPQGRITGGNEWLTYRDALAGDWKMKVHATQFTQQPGSGPGPGQQVTFSLEFVRTTGGDANTNTMFKFLDWENNKWDAVISNTRPPYPTQPYFYLTRIP